MTLLAIFEKTYQDQRKCIPFNNCETPVDLLFATSCHLPNLLYHFFLTVHIPFPRPGPCSSLCCDSHTGLSTSFRLAQKSPAQRGFLDHLAGMCPLPPTAHTHSVTLHFSTLHDFSPRHLSLLTFYGYLLMVCHPLDQCPELFHEPSLLLIGGRPFLSLHGALSSCSPRGAAISYNFPVRLIPFLVSKDKSLFSQIHCRTMSGLMLFTFP